MPEANNTPRSEQVDWAIVSDAPAPGWVAAAATARHDEGSVSASMQTVEGPWQTLAAQDAALWRLLNADDTDAGPAERRALLTENEAQVVAELLDELAAIYADEPIGRTARTMAVRLWDRLGI